MPFDTQLSPIAAGVRTSCQLCPSHGSCLVNGLSAHELSRWNSVLLAHVPLTQTGKSLFATGDPANAVFVVRAGCIKTYTVDEDGNERVRGFHLPGDVIGLDSFGAAHYPAGAVAVVPSQVCRVSKGQLQLLMTDNSSLTQHLFERASRELRLALSLSGDYTAEQRMAAFLLHMLERMASAAPCASAGGERSFSRTPAAAPCASAGDVRSISFTPAVGRGADGVIKLPMTRRDVANYLRLATETVCRVLTRFEEKGWLKSTDKTLRLNAPVALWALAEPVGICQPRLSLSRAA